MDTDSAYRGRSERAPRTGTSLECSWGTEYPAEIFDVACGYVGSEQADCWWASWKDLSLYHDADCYLWDDRLGIVRGREAARVLGEVCQESRDSTGYSKRCLDCVAMGASESSIVGCLTTNIALGYKGASDKGRSESSVSCGEHFRPLLRRGDQLGRCFVNWEDRSLDRCLDENKLCCHEGLCRVALPVV